MPKEQIKNIIEKNSAKENIESRQHLPEKTACEWLL